MALWTPSQISPHTWIDFSDSATLFDATSGGSAVTNGVGIARAEDKSGNARNFTQSTSLARFTWTANSQNGLGVAVADGGDWLTSVSSAATWAFLNNATGGTVLGVWRAGNVSDPNAIYGMYGSNGGTVVNDGTYFVFDDRVSASRNDTAFSATRASTSNYLSALANGSHSANAATLICSIHDNNNSTAAQKILHGINGTTPTGSNSNSNIPSTGNPAFTLQLGTAGNGIWPMVGFLGEICIFSGILSASNRQLTEGYLAWKWGLQANLPSGHPYKNGAPSVGGSRRKFNASLVQPSLFNGSLIG
jgi:hypothetical protein